MATPQRRGAGRAAKGRFGEEARQPCAGSAMASVRTAAPYPARCKTRLQNTPLRNLRYCALLAIKVQFWMQSKHHRNGSHLAAVAVMFSLWVTLWALEVSPDFHRYLHEDAQSPGHTCLVTQFQHHLLLSGFVAAATPPLPVVSYAPLVCGDLQFLPSYDYRLTPSRAPPAA